MIRCLGLIVLLLAGGISKAAAQVNGAVVYEDHCASCHSGVGDERAPGIPNLMYMSPRSILAAIQTGKMKTVAEGLSEEQQRAVAEWITRRPLAETSLPASAHCSANGAESSGGAIDWSGWGGDITGAGFRDASRAGLTARSAKQLTLKWAFAFPDATQARSQPALVGDRLITGSQWGEVYALDQATGCIRWSFSAGAAVRGAISVTHAGDGRQIVHFADYMTNVYALAASDGRLIWKTKVGRHKDAAVTGSVSVHAGRVYVPLTSMEVAAAGDPSYPCCTSSGAAVALDAQKGTELWYHRVIPEPAKRVGSTSVDTAIFAPSGAPVWSSPTVDATRGRLYIGTGENYTRPATTRSDAVLALDLRSGALAWSFQGTREDAYNYACSLPGDHPSCPTPAGPDLDFGMAPILLRRAKDNREILVVGQKSGMVFGLDPDRNGALVWSTRVGSGSTLGGVHWGISGDSRRAYVTISDHPRSHLPARFAKRGRTPGVYALDLMNGDILWSSATPENVCGERRGCFRGHSAAPTVIAGVVFAGSLDGWLRAHAVDTGRVLWEFDTARDFRSVNGIDGRGGAIDGPGPVVANGRLFVNSGYGLFSQMPGNLLMAFEVRAD